MRDKLRFKVVIGLSKKWRVNKVMDQNIIMLLHETRILTTKYCQKCTNETTNLHHRAAAMGTTI